jgi:DNA-binding CsgD family transcriptional regulator
VIVSGYLFAIFTAFLRKKMEEWAYVLLLTAFLFLIVPFLIYDYFSIAKLEASLNVDRFFSLEDIIGLSLLIYAIPALMHSVSKFAKAKYLDLAFLCAAILICLTAFLTIDIAEGAFSRSFLFGALMVVIGYTVTAQIIHRKRASLQGKKNAIDLRWHKITRSISILTVCLMPASFLIDMFPALLPQLAGLLPDRFRVFPLYFMLWNLIYFINSVGLHIQKHAADENAPARDISGLGLSEREREIALLIVDGLSYKDIADRLHISFATVKTHLVRIYNKTGTGNKMELAKLFRTRSQ